MLIGVMADSHDNLDALEHWVNYFNHHDADVLLHAGDVISPFCVPVLEGFNNAVYVTFGNNDGDRETLRDKAEGTHVNFREPPVTLDLTEGTVVMCHKPTNLPVEPDSDVDLLVHGHTHERRLEDESSPVTLNPGEAGGWLSGTSSAALVDVDSDGLDVEFTLEPAP